MSDSGCHENDPPRNDHTVNRYSELPEPLRPENLVETVDISSHSTSLNDDDSDREWMLRHAALW